MPLFKDPLNSKRIKEFEKENAVTPQKERWLAFGAMLMHHNFEPLRTFKLISLDGQRLASFAQAFADWWGIYDGQGALETLDYLSRADGHTPYAREFYHKFIVPKKGDKSFSSRYLDVLPDQLQNTTGLEASMERSGGNLLALADRINRGGKAYDQIWYDLQRIGKGYNFTKEEVFNIDRFEAWDFGRVVYIARNSTALGYVKEDEAWSYIEKAANAASGLYKDWREYLAAYALGRALAFGSDKHAISGMQYLLKDENSPCKQHNFKG